MEVGKIGETDVPITCTWLNYHRKWDLRCAMKALWKMWVFTRDLMEVSRKAFICIH